MLGDPLLRATLLVSCGLHLFVLLPAAYLSRPQPYADRKNKGLKVSYLKKTAQQCLPAANRPASYRQEAFLRIPRIPAGAKITGQKGPPPPYFEPATRQALKQQGIREASFGPAAASIATKSPALDKSLLAKSGLIPLKKKISFPGLDLNRVNNPIYVSYYQIVREKIKRAAYRNYAGNETGEVTISFVISQDGDLKGLRLMDEKSSPSPYLRQVALSSIKEALPFPNFPKDLDYPQLSFNLAITFELE
jgi:TonB family protein